MTTQVTKPQDIALYSHLKNQFPEATNQEIDLHRGKFLAGDNAPEELNAIVATYEHEVIHGSKTPKLTDNQKAALEWHLERNFPDPIKKKEARNTILSADNVEQKLSRITSMYESNLNSKKATKNKGGFFTQFITRPQAERTI